MAPPARAEGIELLGNVDGCGYRHGAALVRRADGQIVQVGLLMYALLESIDGERHGTSLAAAMSERLGRRVSPQHVDRLSEKLAEQGLLAGTEHRAPVRRNPLLALRWKVLVTNPKWTRRLTAPFGGLFNPFVMWPVLGAFAVVFWFVLIHKGVASATAQAFHSPGLLLLVFVLAVASAGFHELGHAAACRYGGATPGGMGMGLYLVWPAFYTDVTDTYRLPKRARLRVDLAGLYFNAVVAVVTMGVWLVWRADAVLLLVALQILQMVKQLSPVIRADGYHILSDATGVPDLFAHLVPTVRRLLPAHRHEPSALTGRARLLVTLWVLVIVPVLLSLSLSAIILLPRLATSAWDSGRHFALQIPHQAAHGQTLGLLAALLSLVALALPVLGSGLVTQKVLRTVVGKAVDWSRGRPPRIAISVLAGAAVCAGAAWAWWPSGQYQPVRANQGGTLAGIGSLVASPASFARPGASAAAVPVARLTPGAHLAVAMIPVGGATRRHPALFVIPGRHGKPATAILSTNTPAPRAPRAGATVGGTAPAAGGAPTASGGAATTTVGGATTVPSGAATAPAGGSATTAGTSTPGDTSTNPTGAAGATSGANPSAAPSPAPVAIPGGSTIRASAFPFTLPSRPGPGGTQALAVNTRDGSVRYDVAYAVVTVSGGAPVTNTNGAFALASCTSCTTVAVSVQVVLIVGESHIIAPIDAAGALNDNCPACLTTAIADQIVVTLERQPSRKLLAELRHDLAALGALPALGANGTPAAIAATVAAVQNQIDAQLNASGLLARPLGTTATTTTPTTTTASTSTTTPTSPGTTSSGTTTNTTTSAGSTSTSSTTTTTGASASTTTTTNTTDTGTSSTTTTTTSGTTSTPASTTTTSTTSAAATTGTAAGSP